MKREQEMEFLSVPKPPSSKEKRETSMRHSQTWMHVRKGEMTYVDA